MFKKQNYSDDNLPLEKTLEIHVVIMVVKSDK